MMLKINNIEFDSIQELSKKELNTITGRCSNIPDLIPCSVIIEHSIPIIEEIFPITIPEEFLESIKSYS